MRRITPDKWGCHTFEPLPVKRTVKNQKILATSNRNVAGCFLWRQTLFHRVCNKRGVSGCAKDELNNLLAGRQPASVNPRPLVRVRIFRVTSSSAARPSASVLSLDSVPAPCVCGNVMTDVIMLREDMNCASRLESVLRIVSGISRCCSNKYSFRS